MIDYSITATGNTGPIPADDPNRELTISDPNDKQTRHVSLVGDI